MKPSLEITELAVVLIGKFNPASFTPQWLAHHALIGQAEAETAEIAIIHQEVSQFSLEWAKFFIDNDRLQIQTNQSPHVKISDFIIKLLSDVLPGTIVTAAGINTSMHYRLSLEAQNKLGEKIAPRELWGGWGQKTLNQSKGIYASGLVSITLRQGEQLDDREAGYIDAKIESSKIIRNGGILININDHYQVKEPKLVQDSEAILNAIRNNFETSITRSERISQDIINKATS